MHFGIGLRSSVPVKVRLGYAASMKFLYSFAGLLAQFLAFVWDANDAPASAWRRLVARGPSRTGPRTTGSTANVRAASSIRSATAGC